MTDDPLDWLVSLDGVASAYAATRDGIDVMLRDRGLRRTSPETTAESLLRGAIASAQLDGSHSDRETVEAGLADPIAQASIRVSTELLGLAPVMLTAPAQALARMHTLAATGTLPETALGRPSDAASARRLQSLVGVLASSAPALMVAAIVHAEVATVAPFASHNALVARAAERLVLVARGVDEKSLVVPEAGHLALQAAYESNLRGYASGSTSGVHSWLLYGAEAFAAGAEASPLKLS